MRTKFSIHDCEIALLASVSAVVIGLSSCRDTSNPITKIDEIVFPDSNISYEKQVQPLFNVGCANATCHDRATEENKNLNLLSFEGVRANFGVVIAGDTLNSRLIWSIEGRPGTVPMPPLKPLSQNQIRGLKIWILEGARDTP
jgi:hypothetical protein